MIDFSLFLSARKRKKREKNKKKCGNAVSAPPWHGALMQSQVPLVSSDVFVLDAVRALMVHWSHYSGPSPPSENNACNGRSRCVCLSSRTGLQPPRERWRGDDKSKHIESSWPLIAESRAAPRVTEGRPCRAQRVDCDASTLSLL